MKLTQKLNKITPKKETKALQELQTALKSATLKLKKSKSKKEQSIAKFLESNYIHPQTGLITSKFR
jgi:ribosomal protein L15E